MLPFSSGSFTIALIAICISRVILRRRVLIGVSVAGAAVLCAGLAGALLSGTPVTAFFFATVIVMACMWTVGAGLQGRESMLITPQGAFVGVLASTGFLLLSVLGWDAMTALQGAPTNRGVGLYYEPSHYALFVMPLWLIAYQHQQYRLWLYGLLAFAAVTCFSTTLAAFLICAFALKVYLSTTHEKYSLYKLSHQIITGCVVVILAYNVSSLLYLDGVSVQTYVVSRLYSLMNPNDVEAYNLSSLVVLQGIELAQLSFLNSFGMGVGLGNFGTNSHIVDQSIFRPIISTITSTGTDLSLRDGGLLASKLVGELGILALAILLLLARYLRRIKAGLDGRLLSYHSAFAVALICVIFVRALPYFSAPVCLAVFSMAGLLDSRSRLPARRRVSPPHLMLEVSLSRSKGMVS